MSVQMTNQAVITFESNNETATVLSNLAAIDVRSILTVRKRTLESAYRSNSELTYALSLVNNGTTALTDLIVSDDLGAYTIAGPVTVLPLTYTGSPALYINGLISEQLTAQARESGVVFRIPAIPALGNALLLFKARVNEFALLSTGAALTNDAAVTAAELTSPVYVSCTIPVDDYAEVRLIKQLLPDPATEGEPLSMTFAIQNYGNLAADNVRLIDRISPALSELSVTVDGAASTDFDDANGVFVCPSLGSSAVFTVPPAAFSQDAATGAVRILPGVLLITASGKLPADAASQLSSQVP